jgi:hypothetical protein
MLETAMPLIVGSRLRAAAKRDCDTNDRSHDCLLGKRSNPAGRDLLHGTKISLAADAEAIGTIQATRVRHAARRLGHVAAA